MKIAALLSATVVAGSLAGCAVVPYPEPVAYYGAPPPSPVVVVRPSYGGYYGYRSGGYWRRGWR